MAQSFKEKYVQLVKSFLKERKIPCTEHSEIVINSFYEKNVASTHLFDSDGSKELLVAIVTISNYKVSDKYLENLTFYLSEKLKYLYKQEKHF